MFKWYPPLFLAFSLGFVLDRYSLKNILEGNNVEDKLPLSRASSVSVYTNGYQVFAARCLNQDHHHSERK